MKVTTTITIDIELLEQIDDLADKRGSKRSAIANEAIKKGLPLLNITMNENDDNRTISSE